MLSSSDRAMKAVCRFLIVSVLMGCAPVVFGASAPSWQTSAEALQLDLGNGVKLSFALHQGYLLGLRQAEVSGMALTSSETVLRPVLAEEFVPDRRIWDLMKFKEVKAQGDAVELHLELMGSTSEEAFKAFFLFTGDLEKAKTEGMSDELRALQEKSRQADAAIEPFLKEHEPYARLLADLAKKRAELESNPRNVQKVERDIARLERQLRRKRDGAIRAVVAANPEAARVYAPVRQFEEALQARALDFSKIHRDYYLFAMNRLPAEICSLDFVRKQVEARRDSAQPGGTLIWRIQPLNRTIAGWPYRGWTSQYEFMLSDGRKVNNVRQVGTWEPQGRAVGNTIVSLRYRGIGGIEFTVQDNGQGGAREAFSTTEILPGAAGKGPVISPAVPDASGQDFTDLGYAMQHRIGAWIAQPARGGGSAFFDFIYRPEVVFVSSFDRMANLRAVTEIFPGDRVISQTDSWWFAQSSSHRTEPQVFLTLVPAQPFARHESRTRWQEVDMDFRLRVSEELGFRLFEVEPAVGINIDNSWSQHVQGIADRIPRWRELGITAVYVHHPGWQNGREKEPGQTMGAGDCAINDWWPLTNTIEPWKNVTRAAARHGVSYHVWLTGMSFKGAPFFNEVGGDRRNWAFNAPDATEPSGYPPNLWNFNAHSPRFMKVFLDRMDRVREEFGYQGFWYDSFQNLFMSVLDWANGTGAPMQRAWWEQIAKWSQQGINMTSESHAFPGLSCSIEVDHRLDDAWWFMQFTSRWFRTDFPNPGTPEADAFAFRMMANKAWAAPQVAYGREPEQSIPSIGRLAAEFTAARPFMRRSYILPEMQGVLWLHYKDNREGVWFPFTDQNLPARVKATPILDSNPVSSVQANHTYRVSADDLLQAFAVRAGPEPDERLGRTFQQPAYQWPAWAKP